MNNKPEYLVSAAIVAFVMIVLGSLFGIFLHMIGYTHVSITSWQYWLMFPLIYVPMIVTIILKKKNIPLTSTPGFIIYSYALCIPPIMVSTYLQQQPITLWQIVTISTICCALFLAVRFIASRKPAKTLLQKISDFFSRK